MDQVYIGKNNESKFCKDCDCTIEPCINCSNNICYCRSQDNLHCNDCYNANKRKEIEKYLEKIKNKGEVRLMTDNYEKGIITGYLSYKDIDINFRARMQRRSKCNYGTCSWTSSNSYETKICKEKFIEAALIGNLGLNEYIDKYLIDAMNTEQY